MDSKADNIPLLPREKDLCEQASRGRKCLILFACMYQHFMSLGFAGGLGVVYVELIRYFDTEHSLAALVQSCYQGLNLVGGIFLSSVITKFGVGLPVIVAGIVSTLCFLLSAWSVNIFMVIILVGVIGGLSMSVSYLGAFVAVGWTFNKQRKPALAALTVAVALSQAVSPNIISALIDAFGWNGAMIITSGLMLNTVPCGLFLLTSKRYFYSTTKITQENAKESRKMRVNVALLAFIIASAAFQGTGGIEAWFLVDIAEGRGFNRQLGTVLLTIMGLCGLTGRVIGTVFIKTCVALSPFIPLSLALILFGLSHYLIITLTKYAEMVGAVVVRGLSIGFLVSLQAVVILELSGLDRFPRRLASYNLLVGLCQIAYSYIGGKIVDVNGQYNIAFYIAIAVDVLCVMLLVVIKCLL